MQAQIGSMRHVLGYGRRAFVFSALIGVVAAAFVAFAPPSAAQDEGANMWRRGGCATCHGGLAQGGGEGEAPKGPNLRRSDPDREMLWETIACGRSVMPYHLQGAYREVSCYGIPVGDAVPEGFMPGRQFSAEELDVLVDFLMEYVVGVRRLNRSACAAFFGGDLRAPVCLQYPR